MAKNSQITGRELIQKMLDPEFDLDAPLCVDMSAVEDQLETPEDVEQALSVPVKIDGVEFRNGEIVLQASAEA